MNEKGSVTIAVIALMPLLLAIAVVVFSGYLVLIADAQARHICRAELLRAQADIAQSLNQLFALNPQARLLRIRRNMAEAKVAATFGTPAHVAAHAELQTIIREQLALALKQKKWITLARLRAQAAPVLTLSKVRKAIRRRQNLFSETLLFDDWHPSRKSAQLNLRKIPAQSLTPDYEPGPRFNRTQEIRVGWSFAISSLLPSWLHPFVKLSGLKMSADCSATLVEENKKWRPQLTKEDK